MLIITILSLANICLLICYLMSSLVILLKVNGAVNSRNAVSANLSAVLLLTNKVFISICLMCLALSVDLGTDIGITKTFFGSFCILCGICHLLIPNFLNSLSSFLVSLLRIYSSNNNLITLKLEKKPDFSINYFAAFAMLFFYAGFTMPTILALSFTAYKVTLFQLSFLLNAIGSVITVSIIERKVALMADDINVPHIKIANEFTSIVYGRGLAMLLYGIILLCI